MSFQPKLCCLLCLVILFSESYWHKSQDSTSCRCKSFDTFIPCCLLRHKEPESSLPCSMHWSDLHRLLIKALPEGTVRFSHKVSLLEQDDSGVHITADTPSGEMKFEGDIVIAADGVGSFARKQLVPGDSRRCETHCSAQQ